MIVEFPSHEAARAAYDSTEYQDGIELRCQAGIVDFVIVEGYDD